MKASIFVFALLPFFAMAQPQKTNYDFLQRGKVEMVGRDPLKLGYYRISRGKLWGWGISAFAGFVDGVVEGYEFDGRKSFERKWGVDPYGYFGSKSYEVVRSQSIKRDFYHNADEVRKIGYIGSGITIGIGGAKVNVKWWHYAIDFGAGLVISGLAKSQGLNWVRYESKR